MGMSKLMWSSLGLLGLVVIWLLIYGVANQTSTSSADFSKEQIASLAKCLTDKGYKLYGAEWCGHCKDQKEMFGASVSLLNYIECSTPDGSSQTEVCDKAGIEVYPTWGLPNGELIKGVVTLKDLANQSGCLAISS